MEHYKYLKNLSGLLEVGSQRGLTQKRGLV